tara:strand:- start:352 stop:648 length:297 start_codon:yes stop_codon:yes gene_type:complete
MVLRHLSTGVYWLAFLYFVNYTIDIILKIDKECKQIKMNHVEKVKCFFSNIKFVIALLCCFISYYLAYYSPQFGKGSLLDKGIGFVERQLEKTALKIK